MKLLLKDFQTETVERLYTHARGAKREAEEGVEQAIVLASPTGSGKTIIATALMERILGGDDEHAGDGEATFLWLTDQPDLNEQSRRKILSGSTTFGADDVITIESSFDRERFDAGKVYFLNTQKVGGGTLLTRAGDDRDYMLWETIANTAIASPGSFWLVLDEAHKGMLEGRDAEEAASIAQKFIKGSVEIPPIKLILGISATPQRFVEMLEGSGRTRREVPVDPEAVRASGLLKETIMLFHPRERQPADVSLLRASAEKLKTYAEHWSDYCVKEEEPRVDPLLVVQVEDSDGEDVSATDLSEALDILEDALGPLSEEEVGHAFQERHIVAVGDRSLRYVAPADIESDAELRVVFFKLALNTGWDCPRAEVIMSFRRAQDDTRIAQLVGRLVRTPLARAIHSNDFLNSVSLYLPHYDERALQRVIDYLTAPDTGLAAPPEIVEGDEVLELSRDPDTHELFALAETLPTYSIERIAKASNVRRLIRLGRALAYDKLEDGALDDFRDFVITALANERERLAKEGDFNKAMKERAEIDLRGVPVKYGVGAGEESFDAIAVVSANIEDLYAQSGRKLGEGLHTAYLRARVAEGTKPTEAKLELATLLDDAKTARKLEEKAGHLFGDKIEHYKASIRDLPEARRDAYRKLRRQAVEPEPEELELPEIYETLRDEHVFSRHLYVDGEGEFPCKLNTWERDVVEAELEDDDVLGWLRNVPRKSWAFKVPYKYEHDDRPMYPDFLFFRRQGGGVVVDVLEPHSLSQADSTAKAQGLADFAARHGDLFGRIELIVKEKGTLIRLDVNKVDVRDKVRTVSGNEHLRELFDR